MELKNLYFQMLKNGIEELRTEKYQQERNGQAEALQITLDNLIELVNKTNDIHDVMRCSMCDSTNLEDCGGGEYTCLDCGHFPITA